MTIKEIMENVHVDDSGEQRAIYKDRKHGIEHRIYETSLNVVRDDMRINRFETEIHAMNNEATAEEILAAVGVRRRDADRFSKELAEIAEFLKSDEKSCDVTLANYGKRDFTFRVTKDY